VCIWACGSLDGLPSNSGNVAFRHPVGGGWITSHLLTLVLRGLGVVGHMTTRALSWPC